MLSVGVPSSSGIIGVSVGADPLQSRRDQQERQRKNSVRSKGYSVSSKGYGVSSKGYKEQRKWTSVLAKVGAVLLTVIVAALAGYTLMRDTPAPTSVPRVSATSG